MSKDIVRGVRLTKGTDEWLIAKASGVRGRISEIIELALVEMRQNMEAKRMNRRRK